MLAGTPYVGSSAGFNIAGPTILTTNDWNVVALGRFDAVSRKGGGLASDNGLYVAYRFEVPD